MMLPTNKLAASKSTFPDAPEKAPLTALKAHSLISPATVPSNAQPPKVNFLICTVAPAKSPSTAKSLKAHSPVSPVAPTKAPSTAQPVKSHSHVLPFLRSTSSTILLFTALKIYRI
ncbi:hypothetical protein Bca4012_101133 [Brassica carinata]|uniref:Uncharacterized protein n=1 Tax=Brassica carinata TaxID=52824 RepID=A0A8X7PML8_BRACI|nr:hypothetical protein Bca52824_083579 [Brassica carinata]